MRKYAASLLVIGSLILGGCGDDPVPEEQPEDTEIISIGGTLTGLIDFPMNNSTEDSVTVNLLASDGVETVELFAANNGAFVFEDKLKKDENYIVSIAQQPKDQTCVVEQESGKAAGINITNIVIRCI